ncbi:MAG: FAD-dependent oxidoreductase [Clostridia bacterium]
MADKTTGQVKCLICGEVFDSSLSVCPVCGAGSENFVQVEAASASFSLDTDQVFLVLGGGVAAVSAAESIRQRNDDANIVIIHSEPTLPYNRPMLTKSIAADTPGNIAIHDENWYEHNRIYLVHGVVEAIDPTIREVLLSGGDRYIYDKCIYALGAESFIPPIPGTELPGVISIRAISDVERLRTLLHGVNDVVLIGGGVLGLEAASELKKLKKHVSVVELAPRLMGRQLDEEGSAVIKNACEAAGISVMTGVTIAGIRGEDGVQSVELGDGTSLPAQLVVMSCGIRANVAVAKAAGAQVGKAIVVDEHMQTSLSGIFAAGDCAEYSGINYAIWPEASEQGRVAGANAAGDRIAYGAFSPAVTFMGLNTALFALGDVGTAADKQYEIIKPISGDTVLEKYYFLNERLCGCILVGDISKLASVMDMLARGASAAEFRV